MFDRLLVAMDGSDPSKLAIAAGLALASGTSRQILFTSVVDRERLTVTTQPDGTILPDPRVLRAFDRATTLLAEAAAAARAASIQAETLLCSGDVVPGLVELAAARACDLIVMGTHGRSGLPRFVIGSTAEGVLRESTVPALVVRAALPDAPLFSSVLVAVDASDTARAGFQVALDVVRQAGGKLSALTVVPTAQLRLAAFDGLDASIAIDAMTIGAERLLHEFERQAVAAGVETTTRLCDGDPVESILAAAHDSKATLLVMATHGRTGATRALLGSITESTVRRADIPVLVLREPG